MAERRVIACVALMMLVLVPALGLAADDLSGPHRAGFHETGLRHPPGRAWRTVPAAIEPHNCVPRVVLLTTLDASEPSFALPLIMSACSSSRRAANRLFRSPDRSIVTVEPD